MDENEIWKVHHKYPSYEFSNLGRCRRANDKSIRLIYIIRRTGVCFVACPRKIRTNVWENHTVPLSVAIALLFIGKRPSKKHQVAHMDFNKLNSRADNLKYLTQSENQFRAYKHGIRTGNTNYRKRLTPDEVKKLWELHESGLSQVQIGKMLNTSNSNVSKHLDRQYVQYKK
jgi:hypothetical protein